MKQIFQNLGSGEVQSLEVPVPQVRPGQLLIQTRLNLVSPGTEKMLLEFGKSGLLGKALQQPERVKDAVQKAKTDGVLSTVNAIYQKLDDPLPLGYCNVGTVIEVGSGCEEFKIGDLVVSNGPHAEVVTVPKHLCARVPPKVNAEQAAYTVLGSIAMQGVRLAAPAIGETVAVFGLGLVGLLTVQILKATGCKVVAFDFDSNRVALAQDYGASGIDLNHQNDPITSGLQYSNGYGVDAAIITASTPSSDPIHQAAQMCRQRGKIVLVGVTGLELRRDDFYKKELSFQVSASYGPGRYDDSYELHGNDYPIGFVRWTENRNFKAFLGLLEDGSVDTLEMNTHSYSFDEAPRAYDNLASGSNTLGILLKHNTESIPSASRVIENQEVPVNRSSGLPAKDGCSVTFVGVGNFAKGVLIPAFKKSGARLNLASSNSGADAMHAMRKNGFNRASASPDSAIADPESNAIVVCTRHDSHAKYVIESLRNGKHVFVEKPLCIHHEELAEIDATYQECLKAGEERAILMVGFNRRFSPHIKRVKDLLSAETNPITVNMQINAGAIESGHWTQRRDIGGGRLIGEVCHFVDLSVFLAGSSVLDWSLVRLGDRHDDTLSINMKFQNGSIASIQYFCNGNKAIPKERLEVFSSGKSLTLDNYRKLTGYGWGSFKRSSTFTQDKGHKNCASAFVEAVNSGAQSPIPYDDLMEVSKLSIEMADSI